MHIRLAPSPSPSSSLAPQPATPATPNDSTVWAYTGGKPFDPTLPCIVFLHGALHDHSVWTLLARWWAHHGYCVLALDLPAHGRSDGSALPTVEALGDWVLRVLDAAGVQQATLVGHSMGSLIALAAAAQAPGRVSHLVMVATAAPMRVSDALLTAAREQPAAGLRLVNDLSHAGLAAKPAFPGPGAWLHGANLALMERVLAGHTATNLFVHDFSVCNAYAGALSAAAAVQARSTLILGARDQMTPPKASAELARRLNASIHTLPGGHALMQECPDGVLQALRDALS